MGYDWGQVGLSVMACTEDDQEYTGEFRFTGKVQHPDSPSAILLSDKDSKLAGTYLPFDFMDKELYLDFAGMFQSYGSNGTYRHIAKPVDKLNIPQRKVFIHLGTMIESHWATIADSLRPAVQSSTNFRRGFSEHLLERLQSQPQVLRCGQAELRVARKELFSGEEHISLSERIALGPRCRIPRSRSG